MRSGLWRGGGPLAELVLATPRRSRIARLHPQKGPARRRGRAFAWWSTISLHALVDGSGTQVASTIMPGQRGEALVTAHLTAPLLASATLAAERAYDIGAPRRMLVGRGLTPVTPPDLVASTCALATR